MPAAKKTAKKTTKKTPAKRAGRFPKFDLQLFQRVCERIQTGMEPTVQAILNEGMKVPGFYQAIQRMDADTEETEEKLSYLFKKAQTRRDQVVNQQKLEEAEAELARRAVSGWEEPVFQQGIMVGTKRKYSDTCLIVMLKALCPEKYRENTQVEIHNQVGGHLPNIAERKLMEADLARYVRHLAERTAQAMPARK